MNWFILAVLTAISQSVEDVLGKINLRKFDEYIVSFSLKIFSLPILFILLLITKIPTLGNQFWLVLIIGGLLNTIAIILYMRAIKLSDLSVTIPMLTFTPVFLLITSPLIVAEFPSFVGLMGILLIVTGSYSLNITERHKGVLAPFKALLREMGPRLMLIVAFIWGISSNLDKLGVKSSSAVFWPLAINGFIALMLSPIILFKSRKYRVQISSNFKPLAAIGLAEGLKLFFQMSAINLSLVVYVISIKRTSAVISVLLSYLILKEKRIKERLIGVITMTLGVLLIGLS